jgi:hypothetical protein
MVMRRILETIARRLRTVNWPVLVKIDHRVNWRLFNLWWKVTDCAFRFTQWCIVEGVIKLAAALRRVQRAADHTVGALTRLTFAHR